MKKIVIIILVLLLLATTHARYLGGIDIDDTLTWTVNTHTATTGAATDADSVPTYRIYEDETTTPILTGSMALLDSVNTTGFYSEQITCSAANGFEQGKSYNIYVTATVNSVTSSMTLTFQMGTASNLAWIQGTTLASATPLRANIVQVSDDATAADNLESWLDQFANWYDSVDNELKTDVQEVLDAAPFDASTDAVLVSDGTGAGQIDLNAGAIVSVTTVDTTTTNTDMRGTDNAATAAAMATAQADLDIITGADGAILQSNAITTSTILDSAITAAKIATNAIGADETNQVDSNMTAISGDSTAADNLEATYDGTGYNNDVAPAQQQQVNNIANTGAAINTVSESATLSVGSQTNTYTATQSLNGTYHIIDDTANEIDIYYQFDIGATGVPVSCTLSGRLFDAAPVTDTIEIYAYNWGGTAWQQVGDLDGVNSAIDEVKTVILFSNHVGTGANAGKVRLRFQNAAIDATSNLNLDLLYCSYSVVASPVGYANGAIWIDTLNGAAGTTANVNGTADNPVDNWADAQTLSTTTGLSKFQIAQGSAIVLDATLTNKELSGLDYTVDLSDEQVDNCTIAGGVVSGVATGNGGSILFLQCKFLNVTIPADSAMVDVAFFGTITCGEAGDYVFNDCFSAVAGTSTPILDLGGALLNQDISMRKYSGGIELRNFGAAGTDNMSLEGNGQLVIASTSDAGTIAIRGNFTITDNAPGGFSGTLSDLARFDLPQFFTGDSGTTYGSAVSGSVVKEIVDNAGGGGLTLETISEAVWTYITRTTTMPGFN
jgi:hypothetical protein